jgi:UDP:flavonoid glycosyltransferase YjiC (YdhE family)
MKPMIVFSDKYFVHNSKKKYNNSIWSNVSAHPNCVLFITHGGLLSITETIHFGKPIIGIPVFADQFTNIERAVKRGFGRKVPLTFTMAADLKVAINEILSNPR